MNRLFFIDYTKNRIVSYSELLRDINESCTLKRVIYDADYYTIFKSLILSWVVDKRITLLDYDLSAPELEDLGIAQNILDQEYNIDFDEVTSLKDIWGKIKNLYDWRITLFTSGTTGTPKKIIHSIDSLIREVKISPDKQDNVWGFAYNPTHIAGLQVFLQAFMNGNTIVNLFGLDKDSILGLINKYHITHISATPTFYRLIVDKDYTFPSVIRITSGGERFDTRLQNRLQKMFPNAKLLNVYASTEAGTIFAARDEDFCIPAKYKDKVKIVNNEIYIHKSLVGLSEDLELNEEWYPTGDMVEIINTNPDIVFKFISRKNEVIKVGGYKVNPIEVEHTITSHPDVITARVYAIKSSVLGNMLASDIKTRIPMSEREIRGFLSDKLQPFKIPRIINFINDIELTRTGKIKRG